MMHYGLGMGGLGWMGMVIFWGAFIWLIVWLINQNKQRDPSDTPGMILKKRLANGEISSKEYDDLRKKI